MRKLDITLTINKPAKVVWDYMHDPDNMPKWLDNLERFEQVSSEFGAVGAVGKHHYIENGKPFVMEEKIVQTDPPKYIKLSITSKPMDMIVENTLKPIDKNTTEFRAVAEFTRVALFMKLMMMVFMPAKKAQAQHAKQMNKLKELIEEL